MLLVSDLRSLVLAFAIIGVAFLPPACLFISLISFKISRHHRLFISFQMNTAQTSSPRMGKLFLLMVLDPEAATGLVNKVDHREWPCLDLTPLGNFQATILTHEGNVPTFYLTFLRAKKEIGEGVVQGKVY